MDELTFALMDKQQKTRVIAIVGPTASGKSGLAVRFALALGGEVISGDSMQIYKGMDIGTAKVTADECRGVPHHLIDLRSPRETFNAAEYQMLARQAVQDIVNRRKVPVFAGGTGLYIDSALYNYTYNEENNGTFIRESLKLEAQEKGMKALWERLRYADPPSAEKLHPNDTKRIIRALEYIDLHGKPISQNRAAYEASEQMFSTIMLGLDMPRKVLYERIDKRVDSMMGAGFPDEVLALKEQGLRLESQAGQAIGYKQLLQYFEQGAYLLQAGSSIGQVNDEQGISLAQAVSDIKKETRHYAKRQLTWFRRNKNIIWLDARKAVESDRIDGLATRLRERFTADSSAVGISQVMGFVQDYGLLYDEDEDNRKRQEYTDL